MAMELHHFQQRGQASCLLTLVLVLELPVSLRLCSLNSSHAFRLSATVGQSSFSAHNVDEAPDFPVSQVSPLGDPRDCSSSKISGSHSQACLSPCIFVLFSILQGHVI